VSLLPEDAEAGAGVAVVGLALVEEEPLHEIASRENMNAA